MLGATACSHPSLPAMTFTTAVWNLFSRFLAHFWFGIVFTQILFLQPAGPSVLSPSSICLREKPYVVSIQKRGGAVPGPNLRQQCRSEGSVCTTDSGKAEKSDTYAYAVFSFICVQVQVSKPCWIHMPCWLSPSFFLFGFTGAHQLGRKRVPLVICWGRSRRLVVQGKLAVEAR